MKSILSIIAALGIAGCTSAKQGASAPPLRSDQEYRERTEALAQELYKTGQAPNIQDARLQALSTENQEWAAAAKAAEGKAKQEKFEQDLSDVKKLDGSNK